MNDNQRRFAAHVREACGEAQEAYGLENEEIEEVFTLLMHEMDGHEEE